MVLSRYITPLSYVTVSGFATSIVPGVALEEQVKRLRFYFKRRRDTDVGHAFNVIGYHRDRRVSTLWSILIQIISYKEQKSNARNPGYVALELTP